MLTHEHQSAQDLIARTLVGGIAPGVLPEGEQAARLSEARRLCREGNPFPLIAMQWPELVIEDPAEAKLFEPISRGIPASELNPSLRLDYWQRMIALAFFDDSVREIYIKGCTGAGKGGIVAVCTNLLYDVNEILRFNFTGPKFEHTLTGIFGETMEWRRKMRFPQPAGDGSTTIASSHRHYIKIQNPPRGQGGENFSGTHSQDPRGTWFCFDEASSAEDNWFENAEKNAFKIVALSNPRTVMGHFRNAFKPLGDNQDKTGLCNGKLGKRLCVTIGGRDCMNVRHGRVKLPIAPPAGIEIDGTKYEPFQPLPEHHHAKVKPLIPGQMDATQFHAACSAKEPWKVRCFAHGMFPDEDPEAQVILSSWLPRHKAAWEAAEKGSSVPVNAFGLDVARSLAGDCSSLAAGSGAGCAAVMSKQLDNYPAIAEWVLGEARDKYGIDLVLGNRPVCIDIGGGYGSGVGDWLAKAGVWVIESVPAGRAMVLPEVYQDIRTEMYALLGRRLSPDDEWANDPWALPDEPGLDDDLLSAVRKWTPDHTRFRLMPKELIKEHLGRSPDKGDAVALLFMAVREQDQLNEFFAATSGELIAQAGGAAYEPRQVPTPPMSPRNVSQQIAGVVEWMRERNARRG